MQQYIFNWIKNSENILTGKGYTTYRNQNMEQIALFSYLLKEGYTKEEIYEIWVDSSSLSVIKTEGDEEQRMMIFNYLFTKAQKFVIPSTNSINIYQEEIDFINSMLVFKWIKEYILVLLCIYKFYNTEYCIFNNKLRRFCFSMTSQRREWSSSGEKLSDCVTRYHPYSIISKKENLYLKMNFCRQEGKLIKTLSSPEEATQLYYLIKCEKKCKDCGRIFNYSSYTINSEVCAECAKKRLHKLQYRCHKNNKPLSNIEK